MVLTIFSNVAGNSLDFFDILCPGMSLLASMTRRQHLLAVPSASLITALSLLAVNPLLAGEPARMTHEVWNSLPGSQISDLTSSPRYWQTPDSVTTFSGARAPTGIGNASAARVRALITAPATGDYTFWIASDDSSELWLSPTASKFGRVRIASVVGVVGQQAWDVRPTQKSAPIPMVAGRRYFIEALHKNEAMADHLSIAWQAPGGIRELIHTSALESFTADPDDSDNDELPDSWETLGKLRMVSTRPPMPPSTRTNTSSPIPTKTAIPITKKRSSA